MLVYEKDRPKYRSVISFRSRRDSLGIYHTLRAAWEARRAAERALFDVELLNHGMNPISGDETVASFSEALKTLP